MLKEIHNILQDSKDLSKRWFTSDDEDLYIWLENSKVVAFEYCYDKLKSEHMLCWHEETLPVHSRVDEGEHPGGYKRSPICVPDGDVDPAQLALKFEASGNHIEPVLYRQILKCLYNL